MDNLLSLIKNGYCVLPQVLEQNYILELRESAKQLHRCESPANDSKTAFYDTSKVLFNHHSQLFDAVEHILTEYFSESFLLNRSWLRSSYPGYKGSNWHQDQSINIVPCPIIVAIPLSNTNQSNGALRFVPRTQTLPHPRFNNMHHRTEKTLNTVTGDVLMFQSALWHRGGPNETDEARNIIFAEFKSSNSLSSEFSHKAYQSFQANLKG